MPTQAEMDNKGIPLHPWAASAVAQAVAEEEARRKEVAETLVEAGGEAADEAVKLTLAVAENVIASEAPQPGLGEPEQGLAASQ